MHEIGIAASILERVSLVAQQHGTSRITKVGIRLGPLSGVDPEALSFSFEVLAKDTSLEGARLEIERSHRVQLCASCGRDFEGDFVAGLCPGCGSPFSRCIAGDELDLSFVELEEPQCV